MARHVVETFTDDLSPEVEGTREDVQTVEFVLFGIRYRADFGKANRDKLNSATKRFRDASPDVTENVVTIPADEFESLTAQAQELRELKAQVKPRTRRSDRDQNKEIREWAESHGKELSDRGRIPAEIVDEYNAWKAAQAQADDTTDANTSDANTTDGPGDTKTE